MTRRAGSGRGRAPATAFLIGLLALMLAACGSTRPEPLEKAVADATDRLVAQTGRLPAFLAPFETSLTSHDPQAPLRRIVIDPMLDTTSGQQTETTVRLENLVTQRMTLKFPRFELLPFQPGHLNRAQYLMTGTMTRTFGVGFKRGVRLNLALTDLKTGRVVAQSSVLAREEGLDGLPLRYYRDSPIVIKDRVSEGYARTSATRPGLQADPYYLERIAAAALINEATTLYNAERYRDALGQYQNVLADPNGRQLRVQSGIYLANVKLGRLAEAEQAFGRIVALGIDYNELGVKFLFSPGSTEFWSDPKISGYYGMWLRQIAREALASDKCMNVVGHTSASGLVAVNDALSLRRAVLLRQLLVAQAPPLASRMRAVGMGSRENIVGSGSDDGFDVLDRRVGFKIVPCG